MHQPQCRPDGHLGSFILLPRTDSCTAALHCLPAGVSLWAGTTPARPARTGGSKWASASWQVGYASLLRLLPSIASPLPVASPLPACLPAGASQCLQHVASALLPMLLPAGGAEQPFYHVLPHQADRPGQAQTYVAQENIELQPLEPPLCSSPGACCAACACCAASAKYTAHPSPTSAACLSCIGWSHCYRRPRRCPCSAYRPAGYAMHPEAGRYFDALAPAGDRYTLNAWMRHCYPDDWAAQTVQSAAHRQ